MSCVGGFCNEGGATAPNDKAQEASSSNMNTLSGLSRRFSPHLRKRPTLSLPVSHGLLAHGKAWQKRVDRVYGETPLHDAAVQGSTETAKVLLGAGADVHAKDYKPKTNNRYRERCVD